jgi:probable phosphoglycerate mutase
MSKLYMMRHTETLFNVQDKLQGWSDSPLTERGIQIAKDAGEKLRARGIGFDHVYTSTSERTLDTLALLGIECEHVEHRKDLKERGFGSYEGERCYLAPPTRPWGDFFEPYGGESDATFIARVNAAVADIMGRPGHENVLVVCHGAVCGMLYMDVMGLDPRDFKMTVPPCGLFVYDWDGEKLEPVETPA